MSLLVSILEVERVYGNGLERFQKKKTETYRTQGPCAPGNQEKTTKEDKEYGRTKR